MAEENIYKSMPQEKIRAEKKRIRQEVLARRNALSREEQQRASCLITERLLGHQWFYRARILLCYASYGSELDTYELLREALRLKKMVYLPKVCPGQRMEFFRIGSLKELQPGFHGILEPGESGGIYMDGPGDVTGAAPEPAGQRIGSGQALMLMPGVAFDPYGRRLGYGGGYYDRYLAAHPRFLTYSIGIGHQCQLAEELPAEKTDCKPYQVILV